jgi:gamma-glutamyltranspeptidase / glutathione hydrolase
MTAGVIAASDPRAARAGADVLAAGGNAVDAAVAAVLVLFVVEPHACGPGGDAFLLVFEPGRPVEALDGSGAVPLGLTSDALAADGLDSVPVRGARTVTVPGAVGLLDEALLRYGTRTFGELVGPAVGYARDGFRARRMLAENSARAAKEIASDPVLGRLYAPGGRPRQLDELIVNPKLADLLEQIAAAGADGFYRGAIAHAIVDRVQDQGGYLSLEDMRAHQTAAIPPSSTTFQGATVWELPEPTQGPAVLAALDLIDQTDPIDWEQVLEAIQVGLRSVGIDLNRPPGAPAASASPRDTTYLAVIDAEGRAASMITSVFADFGSYLGIDALGGPIHNRATTFYAMGLPPRPGKPPHTTIPALVTRDGLLEHALGLAGGYVQAQVQVQLLIHLLCEGMEPQPAIDAPRMRVQFGGEVALEPGHPLAARFPEAVGRPTGADAYGAAQIASRRAGKLLGGADHRRDGAVIVL